MVCPNCDEQLSERLPDGRWCRHFVCDECWRAYRIVIERFREDVPFDDGSVGHVKRVLWRLEMGRERREEAAKVLQIPTGYALGRKCKMRGVDDKAGPQVSARLPHRAASSNLAPAPQFYKETPC